MENVTIDISNPPPPSTSETPDDSAVGAGSKQGLFERQMQGHQDGSPAASFVRKQQRKVAVDGGGLRPTPLSQLEKEDDDDKSM